MNSVMSKDLVELMLLDTWEGHYDFLIRDLIEMIPGDQLIDYLENSSKERLTIAKRSK